MYFYFFKRDTTYFYTFTNPFNLFRMSINSLKTFVIDTFFLMFKTNEIEHPVKNTAN